jgi:hypothetical protein
MFLLYLLFHVNGLTLLPLTSKGVYKDIYLYFNSFNSKGVFFSLTKLENFSPKG